MSKPDNTRNHMILSVRSRPNQIGKMIQDTVTTPTRNTKNLLLECMC